MIQTLLTTAGVVVCVMIASWLLSVVRRDASVVDPLWGTGFVIVAGTACVLNRPLEPRVLVLALLVTVWGLRLSLHLLWRNWGHGEDRRYAKMREGHGRRFWWVSLFTVFLLQAVILWIVSLPVQVATIKNLAATLGWMDGVGIVLWAIGIVFEAVGDWQLARFVAHPANAGRVMDRGLWRLTRHPNYFGDFCVWWGIYAVAAAGGATWMIASPLLMSLLLLKVSGVTLLESSIGERRPGYAQYQARTNAFFPGWPKAGS